MKNIPRTFILLAGLFLALMPANNAICQSQYSSSPTDALSLWQARDAIIAASKYAVADNHHNNHYLVSPSSIAITFDSLEFNATNIKKETKHFRIDLKNIVKASAAYYTTQGQLETESSKDFRIHDYLPIHDKEGVQYGLWFGSSGFSNVVLCQQVDNAECMHAAFWFAAALNGLHAYAISHPAGSGDFHQQAAAWRSLTTKPPLAEGARILRLAAEDAIKRQKPDEALNDFELGVEADPTWAQGWFNAALLAGELGFYADAADHMQNYLELLPDAADAQSARDQIDLWKYKAGH
jgi:tetratricopeptide (TPR) repeat protein